MNAMKNEVTKKKAIASTKGVWNGMEWNGCQKAMWASHPSFKNGNLLPANGTTDSATQNGGWMCGGYD